MGRISIALAIAALGGQVAAGAVVNIDFEAGLPGDLTYAGDDAALSSAGGTTWTGVLFPGAANLPDEFGGVTPFGVELQDGFTFSDPNAANDLQDGGTGTVVDVVGLTPGELYTFACYVDKWGGFGVEDATGFVGFFSAGDPGADGWSLPGTEGNGGDYFLIPGLQPYEIEPGKIGVRLFMKGALTGLQISGAGGGEPCPGDLDGDNTVGLSDLAKLLGNYGATSGAVYEDGDLDGDGDIDLADLAALLALYGTGC